MIFNVNLKIMQEIIKTKLEKYGYKYSENEHNIDINLGMSQYLTVNFSKNEKIIFKDRLKGWNFLTGVIEMSFKGAIIYQTIGMLFAIFFLMFISQKSDILQFPFIYLLTGISAWLIIWSVYYLIRLENIKTQIIFWIENSGK